MSDRYRPNDWFHPKVWGIKGRKTPQERATIATERERKAAEHEELAEQTRGLRRLYHNTVAEFLAESAAYVRDP